jgi:hypothetical protein
MEDDTEMDLKEIDVSTSNWVDSGQGSSCWRDLVDATLNLRVPQTMGLVRYLS